VWASAAVAAALLVWLGLNDVAVSYDELYSLAWGGSLASGGDLDLFHPLAPLAHPLPVAVGVALSPLDPRTAYDLVAIAGALSLGLLAIAAFRLATVLTGPERGRAAWAAGTVAVLLLLSSDRVDFFAVAATVDVPAAALSVLPVALVLESPRSRPWLPLALLAVAGLLRPEPWGLGLAYGAWLAYDGMRGGALALCGGLAVAPPVLWLLFAVVATGDPLSPINGNPETVAFEDVGFTSPSSSVFPEGPGNVLDSVLDGVRSVPGDELALAATLAVAGSIVLFLRDRRDPQRLRLVVAAAVAAALIGESLAFTALGAAFTDRYVLTAAVIVAALTAALLWRLPPRAALAASALLFALVLTEALSDPTAPTLSDVREKLSFAAEQRQEQEDLYSLTSAEEVRGAIRDGCDQVFIGGEGFEQEVLFARPLVAGGLEIGPERVRVRRLPPHTAISSSFVRNAAPAEAARGVQRGRWTFTSPCLGRPASA